MFIFFFLFHSSSLHVCFSPLHKRIVINETLRIWERERQSFERKKEYFFLFIWNLIEINFGKKRRLFTCYLHQLSGFFRTILESYLLHFIMDQIFLNWAWKLRTKPNKIDIKAILLSRKQILENYDSNSYLRWQWQDSRLRNLMEMVTLAYERAKSNPYLVSKRHTRPF